MQKQLDARRVLAAAALIALAAPACAASLAPAGARFTSIGKMKVSGGGLGADCAVRFDGVTDAAGRGRITLARFSGGFLGACGGIKALGLPWTMAGAAPGRAVIAIVAVHTPYAGDCAAHDVPATIAAGGVITFGHVPMPPAAPSTAVASSPSRR